MSLLQQLRNVFEGRRVLVTGGLGFVGSNLALALNSLGANVTVVDALVPGCGGDPRNLDDAEGAIRVVIADIADATVAQTCLDGVEVIFNLAGEISHSSSTSMASRDLALNVGAQLGFLDQCTRHAPGARVVYTSTRQVYGAPLYLPVDEKHPAQPIDFNGVHKLAAAHYHLLLWRMQQLDAVVLYLTNVYGPRIATHLPHQGFLANFLSHAVAGKPLRVYGDGTQLRDPLYVDDAVQAILHAGAVPVGTTRVFNIGHSQTHTVLKIAQVLSSMASLPEPILVPFPDDRRQIDVGSYTTDTRRAELVLGWTATTGLEAGLKASLKYFGLDAESLPMTSGDGHGAEGQEHVA